MSNQATPDSSYYKLYLISLGVIFLDQVTKWIVKSTMLLHQSVSVIGETVQLTFVENPGMAFGIRLFQTHPFLGRWFFTIVSFVASGILIWYIYKMRYERMTYRISLALILGGAIGNLVDRLIYGRVVDFMDVDVPDMLGMQRWPVFNVADSAVVCGMILMTCLVLLSKSHSITHDNLKEDSEPSIANEKAIRQE
jgi:signal peptidase II